MNQEISSKFGKFTWLMIGLGIPLLLVALLVVAFVMNNRPPNIVVPTPRMPSPNGYDDFTDAAAMSDEAVSMKPFASSWTKADYYSFYMSHRHALGKLREGLHKPYRCSPDRCGLSDLETHASWRQLNRALVAKEKWLWLSGRQQEAADAFLDSIDFSLTLPKGAVIEIGELGAEIECFGESQLASVLPHMTKSDLDHVAIRLVSLAGKRVPFSDLVLAEGYAWARQFNEMYSQPDTTNTPLHWVYDDTSGRLYRLSDTVSNIRHAFTNKRKYVLADLTYHKQFAKEQRKYYTGKSAIEAPESAADCKLVPQDRIPFLKVETAFVLLEIEVALRRYRFDHNSYPASLKSLTPEYLKKTPIDPFGLGKPLRYKPLNNGQSFLLYSLGPNLKDDGGTQGKWKGEKTKGDIVAGKWQ